MLTAREARKIVADQLDRKHATALLQYETLIMERVNNGMLHLVCNDPIPLSIIKELKSLEYDITEEDQYHQRIISW